MLAVVQEAYILGVSTRRVEDLVEALGVEGISKSLVSRICAALDAFRAHSLSGEAYPYLWLDATYVKVREGGRVVNMAWMAVDAVSSPVAPVATSSTVASESIPATRAPDPARKALASYHWPRRRRRPPTLRRYLRASR